MSLPPVDPAALPRDVRAATPERRRDYVAALGFERQLVTQLTRTLGRTTGAKEHDLVPGAMADALMDGGGLGLARLLWRDGGVRS